VFQDNGYGVMDFRPIASDLFFTRNDPQDPRLGDRARHANSTPGATGTAKAIAIFGYPDDEGIRVNGGRPGAAQAPDQIRKFLYKMTPSLFAADPDGIDLVDFGNLETQPHSLPKRHEIAEHAVFSALQNAQRALCLGGGHDYGYPDAAAFIRDCQAKGTRPLILNFDAHLDVRPLNRGLSSGTPFYRMLETFPEVDFAEIGIQGQCNARAHFEWARAKGARILTHEEVVASGEDFVTMVTRRLEDWLIRPRPVFVSIDIDGFSSAYAMGCSQSWATGFEPDAFFRLMQVLQGRLDIRVLGLYEVSPPLDQDDRTAKLAALIAHRFIYPLS
jgi:formiminoglutamase